MLRGLANWKRLELIETFARENKPFEGRTVGDVVAERGGDPFDVLLDLVLADELRTGLRPAGMGETAPTGSCGPKCGAIPGPSSAGRTPAPTST